MKNSIIVQAFNDILLIDVNVYPLDNEAEIQTRQSN